MKTLTKIELLKDSKKYFEIEISNTILQNYIKKDLIKLLEHYHERGIRGSITIYPKNSSGMLYLIRIMQDQGMKLGEIKTYLNLLNLDIKVLKEIKEIIKGDKRYRENILLEEGITPEIKAYILKMFL
ncbi:hypothetical protein ES703_27429 [subsurface metagenome]